jgi:hypothetical protein
MYLSCFSAFRRSFVLVGALFAIAFAGCFHSVSPNVDAIICQSDNNCPSGYVCAIKGQPGGCRKGVGAADASADVTESPDGAPAGGDVLGRLDSKINPGDGPVGPDAAADLAIAGQDLPKAQPDGESPILSEVQPEVQPEARSEVAFAPEVRDAPLESRDVGADVPADLPLDQRLTCDGGCCTNGDCPSTAPVCDTATNKCVGCTQRSDCPNACQTCNAGTCAAVKGVDDPSKCAGTCDANGECKAKPGQKCDAVAAGCITGSPCADGYCCNRACTGACEACDLATLQGTCSALPANTRSRHGSCDGSGTCAGTCQGKSDGTCTYPTSPCGTAECATKTSIQAAGTCSAGTCNMPDPVPCKDGATCTDSKCSCPPGTEDCGTNGCINTFGSDVSHCGGCNTVCASNQYCSAGNCLCSLGASVCGGCLGWNFESGTQNWIKDSNPAVWLGTTNGAQNPTTSTTTVCPSSLCPGSTSALQVSMSMDMTTTISSGIAVPLCVSGGTVDLLNRTISMEVYFDGTADFGVLSAMVAHAWSSVGEVQCNLKWGSDMTVHSWFPASCTFVDSFQANHIAIQVNNSGSPWSGTMYIDNVSIN